MSSGEREEGYGDCSFLFYVGNDGWDMARQNKRLSIEQEKNIRKNGDRGKKWEIPRHELREFSLRMIRFF